MKTAQQTWIAIIIMLIGICAQSLKVKAQPSEIVDTGTVLNDIDFKDINGNEFTLYEKLDEGYTVVIELSKTTCSVCWSFSKSGVFDSLYSGYGPDGSITPRKLLPIWIECDPATTDADLNGTGNYTQGDWVTGHDYPIVDLTRDNVESTLRNFFPTGDISFGTPTFIIICPDRKVVFTGFGSAAWFNESMLVNYYVEGRCAAEVGLGDFGSSKEVSSVVLYPNPAIDRLNIQIESTISTPATLSVTNLMGQVLYVEEVALQQGEQIKSLQTDDLASGFYFFSITTDHGTTVKQFVKR